MSQRGYSVQQPQMEAVEQPSPYTQQQLSPEFDGYGGVGGSPMDRYGSAIKDLSNTSELLNEIRLGLRGMIEFKDGDLTGEALMNDKGICCVLTMLRGISSQNTHWTNYNEHHVRNLMAQMNYNLNKGLLKHKQDWEVRDIRSINQIVIPTVLASLQRGFNEGDKVFWKGAITEGSHYYAGREQQKGGSWFNPFSWGKGK